MRTFSVVWSEEDQEWVGLCDEYPSFSWLAKTPEEALDGITNLVEDAEPLALWQVIAQQEEEIRILQARFEKQADAGMAMVNQHYELERNYRALVKRHATVMNAIERWFNGFRPRNWTRQQHRAEPWVNQSYGDTDPLVRALIRHWKHEGKL